MYLCGPFVNFCLLFDFYLCTLSGYHRINQSTQTDVITQPTLNADHSHCGHNDNWGLPPRARSEIIVNTNATTGILYSNHPSRTGDLLGLECNLVKVYRWSKGPILPGNSWKHVFNNVNQAKYIYLHERTGTCLSCPVQFDRCHLSPGCAGRRVLTQTLWTLPEQHITSHRDKQVTDVMDLVQWHIQHATFTASGPWHSHHRVLESHTSKSNKTEYFCQVVTRLQKVHIWHHVMTHFERSDVTSSRMRCHLLQDLSTS